MGSASLPMGWIQRMMPCTLDGWFRFQGLTERIAALGRQIRFFQGRLATLEKAP